MIIDDGVTNLPTFADTEKLFTDDETIFKIQSKNIVTRV